MKRRYTAQDYKNLIKRLRKKRPQLSLSSDFIVGFPGESDVDFAATMDLIEEVGFDQSYSFIYSARPGTPAAELVDNVGPAEKQRRLSVLQARINEMAAQYSAAMVGTRQRILVDRRAKKDHSELAGRCDNNRVVNFSAPPDLLGKFVDVQITKALPNSLRGRLVGTDTHDGQRAAAN